MWPETIRVTDAQGSTYIVTDVIVNPSEIYHLKAAGQENWGKLADVFARVEAARAEGLSITADMYTYTAGATGLDAAMPPWVQEGGHEKWVERLNNPEIGRAHV